MTDKEKIAELEKEVERLEEKLKTRNIIIYEWKKSRSNLSLEILDKHEEIEKLKKENRGNALRIEYDQKLIIQGKKLRDQLKKENAELENRALENEDIFHRIETWINAYPETVFTPMSKGDWRAVREILKSNGYTIDRISADNMRHVLNGIAKILKGEVEG